MLFSSVALLVLFQFSWILPTLGPAKENFDVSSRGGALALAFLWCRVEQARKSELRCQFGAVDGSILLSGRFFGCQRSRSWVTGMFSCSEARNSKSSHFELNTREILEAKYHHNLDVQTRNRAPAADESASEALGFQLSQRGQIPGGSLPAQSAASFWNHFRVWK